MKLTRVIALVLGIFVLISSGGFSATAYASSSNGWSSSNLDKGSGVAALLGVADSGEIYRVCTVTHVGDGIWLTAKHCLNSGGVLPKIRVESGEVLAVNGFKMADDGRDLALLRTEGDPDVPTVKIAKAFPGIGSVVEVSVLRAGYKSSVRLPMVLKGRLDRIETEEGWTFSDVFVLESASHQKPCPGDSGAPVVVSGEIVGVHSAGNKQHDCQGPYGSASIATFVSPEDLTSRENFETLEGKVSG